MEVLVVEDSCRCTKGNYYVKRNVIIEEPLLLEIRSDVRLGSHYLEALINFACSTIFKLNHIIRDIKHVLVRANVVKQ